MRSALVAVVAVLLGQSTPAPLPTYVVPNRPDLTIRTRRTSDQPGQMAETTVLQFKGANERQQTLYEGPAAHESAFANIVQCERRQSLTINGETKTFASMTIPDEAENLTRARREAERRAATSAPRPHPRAAGPQVTITSDSVDTGERRPIGTYVARHVVRTRTTEQQGPSSPVEVDQTDGWYLDLGPQGCWDWGNRQGWTAVLVGSAEQDPSLIHYVQRGTAPTGIPIEETSRSGNPPRMATWTLELLEFSEAPIDPRAFAVPAGYRAALPLPWGGYDFSRPDTLANRVAVYWQGFVAWAKQVVR